MLQMLIASGAIVLFTSGVLVGEILVHRHDKSEKDAPDFEKEDAAW